MLCDIADSASAGFGLSFGWRVVGSGPFAGRGGGGGENKMVLRFIGVGRERRGGGWVIDAFGAVHGLSIDIEPTRSIISFLSLLCSLRTILKPPLIS